MRLSQSFGGDQSLGGIPRCLENTGTSTLLDTFVADLSILPFQTETDESLESSDFRGSSRQPTLVRRNPRPSLDIKDLCPRCGEEERNFELAMQKELMELAIKPKRRKKTKKTINNKKKNNESSL